MATQTRSTNTVSTELADDVSKDEMDTVRAQLLARFPLTPLTVAPTARPNNVLNSPQAAAAWTCKADEKFDQ